MQLHFLENFVMLRSIKFHGWGRLSLPRTTVFACLLFLTFPCGIRAEESDPPVVEPDPIPALKRTVDFEKEILPIFKRNCLACHNVTDTKGDLVLETPATIRNGGENGPVVELGKGMESLLLRSAARMEKPYMPPKNNKAGAERLTPDELSLLRTWIDNGATGTVKAKPRPFQWQPLPPGLHPILALAVAPDGQFAACGRANQIFIYQIATGEIVTRLTDPTLANGGARNGYRSAAQRDFVQSLAFSPDGHFLASGEYRQVKLWQKAPNLPQISLGDHPATALAASADGKWIATAGNDAVIRLWQSATGEAGPELRGHAGAIHALSFSPDSARLASAGADGSVRLWKTADGTLLGQTDLPQPATAVAWLLDGHELATAGADALIHRWQVPAETGQPMTPAGEITGHTMPVTCLTATPDGLQLLSGSEDGSVRQWSIGPEVKQIHQMDAGAPVSALAVSPDGKTFAAAAGNAVRLWGAEKGQQLAELKGDQHALSRLAEAKRRLDLAKSEAAFWTTSLAAASKLQEERSVAIAKTVTAYVSLEASAAEKALAKEVDGDAKSIAAALDASRKADAECVAAKNSMDAARAASESAAQSTADAGLGSELADIAFQKATAELDGAKHAVSKAEYPIQTLAFSPDGAAIATGGHSQSIQSWNTSTGAGLDVYPGHAGFITALTYTKAGRIFSASAGKPPVIWATVPLWTLARTIGTADETSPIANRVLALDFSHDGKLLATGGGVPSRNGEVKIWHTSDGSLAREITPSHSDSVYGLEFSPDDTLLATASADKFVKIFRCESGELVKTLNGHSSYVLSVAWRQNGRMLASGGADKVIKLWSYPSGVPIKSIGGAAKEVTSVQYVGLGGEILSASGDTKVRQLKEDGTALRDYPGSKGFIFSTAATRDGQYILGGGQDSILRIWNGATGKLLYSLPPPAPKENPTEPPAPSVQ